MHSAVAGARILARSSAATSDTGIDTSRNAGGAGAGAGAGAEEGDVSPSVGGWPTVPRDAGVAGAAPAVGDVMAGAES